MPDSFSTTATNRRIARGVLQLVPHRCRHGILGRGILRPHSETTVCMTPHMCHDASCRTGGGGRGAAGEAELPRRIDGCGADGLGVRVPQPVRGIGAGKCCGRSHTRNQTPRVCQWNRGIRADGIDSIARQIKRECALTLLPCLDNH